MTNKNRLPDQNNIVSRRRILQNLSALSGGLIATTMLPGQWIKPIIEVGQLPAHAQGSTAVFTISQLNRIVIDINGCDGPNGAKGTTYEITFNYANRNGMADNMTISQETEFAPSGRRSVFEVKQFTRTGDGYQGKISYSVCTGFGTDMSVTTIITVRDVDGTTSNQLTLTQDKPDGASRFSGTAYETQ
ncbi:hypothetical protein QUF63_03235 [Anaerolineales bacterium HSG25]|nr:hypothetical protein [Anaerolineales bacterium HSG25]